MYIYINFDREYIFRKERYITWEKRFELKLDTISNTH